jgi:hypothetical protein
MNIDVSDASPIKRPTVDETQDFCVGRDCGAGKTRQHPQHEVALVKIAKSDFADHEWMSQRLAALKQSNERRVAFSQMVDPDRGIDKDHGSAWPPARRRPEIRLAAPETRQSPGALALDQRLEGLTNQCGLLLEPGQALGLGHEFVVERHCRAHVWTSDQAPI